MDKLDNKATYMFYQTVMNLWGAVLCGNPTKSQQEIYEKMKSPKIGDFVLENSSGFLAVKAWRNGDEQAAADHIKCMFGTLEEVCREEYDLDDEARAEYEENGEEIPTQKVWYINNLHGIKYRWTNADFITVTSKYD